MIPGPFKPQPRPIINKFELWRKTARVLKLSREARVRLEWMIFYHKHNNNSSLTCRHFGIHRNTLGKWLKVFKEANLRSLETRSCRPQRLRHRQATPLVDQRIIELKREFPEWGRAKLKYLYEAKYHESITDWYLERAIQTYHLYCSTRTKRQKHPKEAYLKKKITELKACPRPGFLLHFDSMVLHLFGLKRYIITGIDHYSRLAYAFMYQGHTSLGARDFLWRMQYLLDQKITNIHTDNGSEFHKYFGQAVQDLNLTHYWSRPQTPKNNAILERFNRTLKYEFLYQGNFHPDINVFNQNLTNWLIKYNFQRPHQALGYLTPMEYAQKSLNLHTRWSSSTKP